MQMVLDGRWGKSLLKPAMCCQELEGMLWAILFQDACVKQKMELRKLQEMLLCTWKSETAFLPRLSQVKKFRISQMLKSLKFTDMLWRGLKTHSVALTVRCIRVYEEKSLNSAFFYFGSHPFTCRIGWTRKSQIFHIQLLRYRMTMRIPCCI